MLGIALPKAAPTAEAKPSEDAAQNVNRFLTMMIEGAARAMPDLDSESWSRMTAEATSIAMQTPDRLPDDDKLAQIQKVLRELEQYGHSLQEQIKARQHEWRIITATLLRELEDRLGFDASEMELRIGDLEKAEDLHEYRMQLGDFLHPDLSGSHDDTELHFRRTDLSTNNINAAGLRGGGSAVEALS